MSLESEIKQTHGLVWASGSLETRPRLVISAAYLLDL